MFQISNLISKMFLIRFCQHGSNFRRKLQPVLEYVSRESDKKNTRPSPPPSKDEGLKDIGHIMSIGNLILSVNSVMFSYLIRYDSLLQNATNIITKCSSCFITNCDSFITKCNSYYKMRRLL